MKLDCSCSAKFSPEFLTAIRVNVDRHYGLNPDVGFFFGPVYDEVNKEEGYLHWVFGYQQLRFLNPFKHVARHDRIRSCMLCNVRRSAHSAQGQQPIALYVWGSL